MNQLLVLVEEVYRSVYINLCRVMLWLFDLLLKNIPDVTQELIASTGIIDKFFHDIDHFLRHTIPASSNFLSTTKKQLIFEGYIATQKI